MVELLLVDVILRIGIAALLGSLVGLERQLRGISVGFRTNALVCLGAALFTIVSIQFSILDAGTDIARVASGVVTGIGFLGAGAIFLDRKGLHGFTTAANIWVVAAIGMMAGIGEFVVSIVATVFILVILFVGKFLEKKLIPKKKFFW